MPTLAITKSYADGSVLLESDLDNIVNDVQDFLNTSSGGGLDDDNIRNDGITGSTKLVDQSVTSGKLYDAAVTTAKINNNAVTTVKILDSAVTTLKINDQAVTTAKLADLNVTEGKIAAGAVTVDKLGALAVTTAKIDNNAVTQAKRAALGQVLSSSCGTFTTNSGSYVDITNLSVSFTSTGRPVMICFLPTSSLSKSVIYGISSAGAQLILEGYLKVLRDTDVVCEEYGRYDGGLGAAAGFVYNQFMPGFYMIDTPSAGTYTYKLQVKIGVSANIEISNMKLMVFEL